MRDKAMILLLARLGLRAGDIAGLGVTDIDWNAARILVALDGWELQRLAVQKLPKLPVVFITAHQDDEARTRAMELGIVALLYKPFDGEELLEIVDAAIKNYHTSETCS
jgi:FixJ family two-component response regulator